MSHSLRLAEGLSQCLVAFTIEYDNEWEEKFWIPSETKTFRVSIVMWENFLKFVPEQGISLQELSVKAGYTKGKLHPSLPGMIRWGFVTEVSGNGKKSHRNNIIKTTSVGRQAAIFWKPLAQKLEKRWAVRFTKENTDALVNSLKDLVGRFDTKLPPFFPVLPYLDGMRIPIPYQPESEPLQNLNLLNLLSMAIHCYTIEFEEYSDEVSLAHRANVLRVLTAEGIPLKAIPSLAGISKEALKMAYVFLVKSGHVVEEPSFSGRGKDLRLTEKGITERNRYVELHELIEKRWENRFTEVVVSNLQSSLNAIFAHDEGTESPLTQGLTPGPNTWRAMLPRPHVLPYHPMVLHRGGWPDGS